MRKYWASLIIILFFLFVPVTVYLLEHSPTVTAAQEKIVYNFPYPGILPDHPLYFLKAIRDRVTDWLTRDYFKKAELYLLYSDKRVAMAQFLAQKGKSALAITTFSKGEKYFWKIPKVLNEAKRQGSSPPSGFVEKLKLANSKHKEAAESLLKELPQGASDALMEIIRLNEEIKKELEKL